MDSFVFCRLHKCLSVIDDMTGVLDMRWYLSKHLHWSFSNYYNTGQQQQIIQ